MYVYTYIHMHIYIYIIIYITYMCECIHILILMFGNILIHKFHTHVFAWRVGGDLVFRVWAGPW